MDTVFTQSRKGFHAKSAEQEGIVCGSVFPAKAQRILRKERREKKAGVKQFLKKNLCELCATSLLCVQKKQAFYSETT